MAEEGKKKEEGEKEDTPPQETETAPAASQNMVDRANEAAERLEKANNKTEELVVRAEEAKAKAILGGEAEAGAEAPKVSKEDAIKARANEKLRGTGLNIE